MKLTLESISTLMGDTVTSVVEWTPENAETYKDHRTFVHGNKLYVGSKKEDK